MFESYKDCLFNDKAMLKPQQRFKSDYHKEHTEEANKIALSSNDDKRLLTFDGIETYPYGTNPYMVCKNEILIVKKYKEFMYNDKNNAKETNRNFKTSVTKCMLNRLIRFRKGEMSILIKNKDFLLDNKNDIK